MKKIPALLLLFTLALGCKKNKSTGSDNLPTGWSQLGTSFGLSYTNKAVWAIAIDKSDNVVICQDYDPANKWTPLKYNGSTWSKMGTLNSSDMWEHLLLQMDAAGNFYIYLREAAAISNSTNLAYIAKYDGSKWSMVGPDNNGSVSTVSSGIPFCVMPSGNVYASFLRPGTGSVYTNVKWGGSSWDAIPSQYTSGSQTATTSMNYGMTSDAAGNLYTAGIQAGIGVISKYNGTAWQSISLPATGGPYTANKIIADNSGNLYAVLVNSGSAYSVAKWNGSSWTILGGLNPNSYINTIALGTNGHLYAAGNFTDGGGKQYIAEWDGSKWGELGGANALKVNGAIVALAVDSRGYVYAGGEFTNTGGEAYVAVYKP